MRKTPDGKSFEEEIFRYFSEYIAGGNFFAKPECCKIFRQKSYYSKDRESDITFDVVIEVSRPGAQEPFLKLIIECKDYGSAIPVDDAEEFFSKIQQIGGANCKGIIASSNSFQRGTYNFARSKGIGLFRRFKPGEFKWELDRTFGGSLASSINEQPLLTVRGLTEEGFRSSYFDSYFLVGELPTNSLYDFLYEIVVDPIEGNPELNALKLSPRPKPTKVEFIPKDDIERLCSKIIAQEESLRIATPLEKICERLQKESGLSVHLLEERCTEESNSPVLGRIEFDPGIITIYRDESPARARFTLAHELGHFFLQHSRYFTSEWCGEADFESSHENSSVSFGEIARLEWQANYFASCLLLPKQTFVKDFLRLLDQSGVRPRGGRVLYVDDQPCNRATYNVVTGSLMSSYAVSKTVIQRRLEGLGLLVREAHLKSSTDHMRGSFIFED